MYSIKNISALCIVVSLTACSYFPTRDSTITPDNLYPQEAMDRIVQNMVYTLAQVESLHPMKTTLQILPAEQSEEKQHVFDRLWEAGYAIQQIAPSLATLQLNVDYSDENMTSGMPFIYRLSAGDVVLSRLYKITNGQSIPLSAMTIKGAQPNPILSNDDIFGEPVKDTISTIVFERTPTTIAVDSTIQASAKDVIADQRLSQKNIFKTLESNYAPTLSEYEDIDTATIIFGNDSLVLRQKGKRVIQKLAAEIDPSTDIVWLVGCSNGSTTIDNGNEVLAMGRAERVKEEFIYAGISKDQILDEGCWSPAPFEVMPSRAVVVTIKRAQG